MGNVRGLRTRLCPRCEETTPHRTLYARTDSGGRTRWLQLFWACTRCGSMNHVLLPRYTLRSASLDLPSNLSVGIVNALQDGPLDFDELVAGMRRRRVSGVRHVFKADAAMTLEFLKGRGVVAEAASDRTERTLDELRARGEPSRLRPCPRETTLQVAGGSLISLYSQGLAPADRGIEGQAVRQKQLTAIGVLCLRCSYRQFEQGSLTELQPSGSA